MKANLDDFLDQPCRFRLKSGKDIYGVIWKERRGLTDEYFFASISEHEKYAENKSRRPLGVTLQAVDVEAIVLAESIAS